MVAMLIDQVLPADRGIFVPFFGRAACTTPALSMAAIGSGSPVFVLVSVREGDHLRLFIEGPIPVPDTGDRQRDILEHTPALTQASERFAPSHPEPWARLHPRWKWQPTQR